jgi:radical SAM protein with 4Fe4S-binding SPASM domain
LVDQSIELGANTVSVFGYGEPFMDKGVEEKIGYCSDKGLHTWITTNASLLSFERAYSVINAGLKNIRFSVHALNPYDYERVHGKLNWLETIGNIFNFIRVNKRLGQPCTVHLTCIPMNGEKIDDIIGAWAKHVNYLEIWRPHNWGNKKKYRKSIPKLTTCGRPFNGPVQIQADGNVIPCCFLTNGEIILGNIYENTLKDILTGSRYNRLRERHTTGIYYGLACEECDQRNIETENPLLYSNRDPERETGKTSTCKTVVNLTT